MIHPREYREITPVVKAMRFGPDNIDIVMRWIGQVTSTPLYKRMNDTFFIDLIEGELLLEFDWWVVKDAEGNFSTYTEDCFREHYIDIYGDAN